MPRKTKTTRPSKSPKNDDNQWGPLFPPRPDETKEAAELLSKPEDSKAYSELLESQCGVADDSQPVEQYNGTLGVTVAFVNSHQGPVGQIQWNNNLGSIYTSPGDVSSVRWCSGTLISNDLFLTAGHCFDQTGGGWTRPRDNTTGAIIPPAEIAINMHVNFNYQVDPSGNLRVEQSFPILNLVEYRLGGLDFAIVRLGGNPGSIFGTTGVSTTDAAKGDMACIIGHPATMPKRIEAGPITDIHDNRIGYNDIDTLGGNSGSGVLRASDGLIVGVHTNGGCTNPASAGHNHGVRITSIIAQSPTLQVLTTPTLKFFDDGGTLKFIDDGGTLKAIDDVKHPALDKQFGNQKLPGTDMRSSIQPGVPVRQPTGVSSGSRPFILKTPHHSMAWAKGQYPSTSSRQELQEQYEATITQLAQMLQQGSDELSQLNEQYQRMIAEYQALLSSQQ